MISSNVISAELCGFIMECNGILQEFMIVSWLSIEIFLKIFMNRSTILPFIRQTINLFGNIY